MELNFYLAQYLQDPIRREPKNVGVIVCRDGQWAGKFLGGVTTDGLVDMRTVTWTKDTKGYRQWVRYWNDRIARGGEDLIDRLMKNNGGNYDVIRGGHLTDIADDTAVAIANRLFPALVEPVVLAPAVAEEGDGEADVAVVEFKKAVSDSFRGLRIFGGSADPEAKRRIYANEQVMGKRAAHTPAYMQSGADCIMEVMNFTTKRKASAKDHAGWAALMFEDIRAFNPKMKTIALVQATKEDLQDEKVDYSMKLLDSVTDVVDWTDKDQRQEFLDARLAAAYGATG
jgi:hypothetical protein